MYYGLGPVTFRNVKVQVRLSMLANCLEMWTPGNFA